MNQEQWTAVDHYFSETITPSDDALDAALKASESAGLPAIQVAPNQGKLLQLLAQIQGAKTILEIGTLGGYSTIWMARALPAGGRLVTLEFEPLHHQVASANVANAGLSDRVELKLGLALEILPTLTGPFDFVFIDADKENIPGYYEWALKLTKPGSVIVVDNVVRGGEVVNAKSEDPNILGVREFMRKVAIDRRVSATAIQTVGSKGYDGLAILRVL